MVSSCLFAFLCRGSFALPCWWPSRGPHNHRAHKPPTAPPRVALLTELSFRGACKMFMFAWKRELVSWACMVHGSHKMREGACFLATEIPPYRTPMSPDWVLYVRNRLLSPGQIQRTIKRSVSYYLSRICNKTENMGGSGVTPGGTKTSAFVMPLTALPSCLVLKFHFYLQFLKCQHRHLQ